jgi:hypothetical protein
MGSEPFVIANPFTSPPVEQALPKLENIEPGAPALTTQPVGVAEEITNTVKVFENADIRVIKLS